MIGLLPFVFASLVWAVHIAGAPSCYRKGFCASEAACSLGGTAWLRRRSAHPTRNSRRRKRADEKLTLSPSKLQPRGCSGGVMSLDRTASKTQAERMRPDHWRALLDSSVEEKRVRFGRRLPRG